MRYIIEDYVLPVLILLVVAALIITPIYFGAKLSKQKRNENIAKKQEQIVMDCELLLHDIAMDIEEHFDIKENEDFSLRTHYVDSRKVVIKMNDPSLLTLDDYERIHEMVAQRYEEKLESKPNIYPLLVVHYCTHRILFSR